MEVTHNLALQKYGRDILLQLRMHPLSLRKPDIQKLDIVKDKLYLHQINNHNNSQTANELNWSPDSFYGSMKFETDAKFCCHRNFQDFFPWHCSFNGCGKKASTAQYGILPCKKWQFPLPNYISPLRKNCLTLSDCQFDSSIDDEFSTQVNSSPLTSWSKQGCTTYASQSKVRTKAVVKNEKKVLPIIDPANGKNILDGFGKKLITSEGDTIFTKEADFEVAKNQNMISEIGDHSWDNEENEDHLVKNQECGDIVHGTKSDEGSSCISQLPKELCDTSSAFNSCCEEKVKQCCDYDISTTVSYKESEKDICKERDSDKFNLNESVAEKLENQQKLNLTILKDKLYSMKKEQQKMAILQSFLRFKKHQIDKSMRNLDDKKIEVANWECNLLNKAKELQEKECWLETKNLTLQNKAEILEEKARALNRKESFLNDKPKQISKVDSENEKYGTECSINAEEMSSDHLIGESNHDYSSMNNVDDCSLDSDRSRENSTEKSIM